MGIVVMTLVMATSVNASIIAGDAVSFLTPGTESRAHYTVGWEFTPIVDTWADKLGFYDSGHDGLSQDHEVRLYAVTGQTFITSATITNIDDWGVFSLIHPTDGYAFKWHAITPVLLTAGTSYLLATSMPGGFIDSYASAPTDYVEHWAHLITGRYADTATSYPTQISGAVEFFGPNIGTTAVPEPSTYIYFTIALGAAGFFRRTNKNKS
jgi:Domain of unknown function (DUF4082)/PEP-CTERM motif